MNRKQKIVLLFGVAIILFMGFFPPFSRVGYRFLFAPITHTAIQVDRLLLQWFVVGLVTVSIIYILKDKKEQEITRSRTLNLRRGFRRTTLILATVAAVICGSFAVAIPIEKYRTAQSHGWLWEDDAHIIRNPWLLDVPLIMKIKPTNPEYDDLMRSPWALPEEELLNIVCEMRLTNQKEKFWKDLSKIGLVSIVILYGLGGVAVGYLGVWIIIWFGGLVVYRFTRWLILGFASPDDDKEDEQKRKDKLKSFPDPTSKH